MSSTYGAFTLESLSFTDQQPIPQKHAYTDCNGSNISPELHWSGPPAGTRSFVLICRDPDASSRSTKGFIHWLIVNIPSSVTTLEEGLPKVEQLTGNLQGALQGTNDFGTIGWDGPCPPSGTHRYFFELYALDTLLDANGAPLIKKIEESMEGKILAKKTIMGTYSSGTAHDNKN